MLDEELIYGKLSLSFFPAVIVEKNKKTYLRETSNLRKWGFKFEKDNNDKNYVQWLHYNIYIIVKISDVISVIFHSMLFSTFKTSFADGFSN